MSQELKGEPMTSEKLKNATLQLIEVLLDEYRIDGKQEKIEAITQITKIIKALE
jgi:hypothetical protein